MEGRNYQEARMIASLAKENELKAKRHELAVQSRILENSRWMEEIPKKDILAEKKRTNMKLREEEQEKKTILLQSRRERLEALYRKDESRYIQELQSRSISVERCIDI